MADVKKASKKIRKFSRKLFEDKGISCTKNPTLNIVICNAGQATGLEKNELLEYIQKNLPCVAPPKYVWEKGQSYSFLVFESSLAAKEVLESGHGMMKLSGDGPPLYMSYVDKVPDRTQVFPNTNPPGLTIIENFISDEEEKGLFRLFDWENIETIGVLKNRQVKHFGYEFRYGSNDVDLDAPLENKIPVECNFIFQRLKSHFHNGMPDQLTVNKYEPGQGIPSHVDKHSPFGSCILSLSLGGAVHMEWKHHTGKYIPVSIPNKSILIMEGEARYDWQHGIQARTWDPKMSIEQRLTEGGHVEEVKILSDDHIPRETRISLTFRWTRSGPCECKYPILCDSRSQETSLLKDDVAAQLENLHVHEVYEKIASHFSTTRHKRWPRVEEFMERQAPGSIVLDLGSGNGKNIINKCDLVQIAAERSAGLLDECRGHVSGIAGADCLRADLLSTPCVDGCADAVICIAVIHHMSNKKRRVRAISEIARLLRIGGEALITVWARDQSKANYLLKSKVGEGVKETDTHTAAGVNLPVHENRTQFQYNDLLVPWKLRSKNAEQNLQKTEDTLLRYYHVFDEGEMEEMCGEVPSLMVVENFYEQGNWCVICRKL